MKSDVETLNPTRIKLSIEVPFDELKPSITKAYKEISEQISVPGFRKGKVPPSIIDQRVGQAVVVQEAINDALPKFYTEAATQHMVEPVGEPDVEVTDIPDLKKGGDLGFTVEVDVRPTIELPDLSEIDITVDDAVASDEDVEAELNSLRERFGTLVGVDRPAQDGDFVSIDLSAKIGDEEIDTAEGISYQIGSGNMLDGTDEALIGLSADEHTTFVAPLRGGDHAGKDAEITVNLLSVKERELPEVDDDFAELASEFDTVEELKADLRTKADEQAKIGQIGQAQELFLDALVEKLQVPVPASMIEAEVQQQAGENSTDEQRKEIEEQAGPAIQRQLILEALAKHVEVDVTQEELINHIVATAPQYGMDPQSFANAVEQAGQIPALAQEVGRRKALLLCLAEAKVTDKAGEAIDLGLVEEAEETEETPADEKAEEANDTK